MTLDLASWLSLALRWFHVITGIAWIGSSFYFIWLDNSLKPPADRKDIESGVGGEVWAVHGGGFYHKKKYKVAPGHMPDDVHWFKWEAYFTWVSGMSLLALIYYYDARLYLIDSGKAALVPWQAALIGLGFIAGGWIVYDLLLCKSAIGKSNRLLGVIWFAILTATAYVLCHIFTGRGAYMHVGAIIGTAMAANVFAIIIPNQKKTVAALLAHQTPDPRYGLQAKQRSVHNNYMTLPVILIMISNHYPMLYGHAQGWLVLAGLCAASLPIREFFNQKHKGNIDYRYPAVGIAGFILVMLWASGIFTPAPMRADTSKIAAVSDQDIRVMITTHCSACHAAHPTHQGIDKPPQGLSFDDLAEIKKQAPRIYKQAVATKVMPLGNETGMTDAERQNLGAWIEALPVDGQ